jgi:hypothetical protein
MLFNFLSNKYLFIFLKNAQNFLDTLIKPCVLEYRQIGPIIEIKVHVQMQRIWGAYIYNENKNSGNIIGAFNTKDVS